MSKSGHGCNCKDNCNCNHGDHDSFLDHDNYFYYYGGSSDYHGMSESESFLVGLLFLGFGIIMMLLMFVK